MNVEARSRIPAHGETVRVKGRLHGSAPIDWDAIVESVEVRLTGVYLRVRRPDSTIRHYVPLMYIEPINPTQAQERV